MRQPSANVKNRNPLTNSNGHVTRNTSISNKDIPTVRYPTARQSVINTHPNRSSNQSTNHLKDHYYVNKGPTHTNSVTHTTNNLINYYNLNFNLNLNSFSNSFYSQIMSDTVSPSKSHTQTAPASDSVEEIELQDVGNNNNVNDINAVYGVTSADMNLNDHQKSPSSGTHGGSSGTVSMFSSSADTAGSAHGGVEDSSNSSWQNVAASAFSSLSKKATELSNNVPNNVREISIPGIQNGIKLDLQSLKQSPTLKKLQQQMNLGPVRSWSTSEGFLSLSKPNWPIDFRQCGRNIRFFKANYAVVNSGVIVTGLLLTPSALLTLVINGVVWGWYLHKSHSMSSNGLEWKTIIGGKEITGMQRTLFLSLLSILFTFFMIGNLLIFLIGLGFVLNGVHSVCHVPVRDYSQMIAEESAGLANEELGPSSV